MTWENPADDIHKWLDAYARQTVSVEAFEVERLLAEAMTLQDLGMLGRLFVVRQDGCAPGGSLDLVGVSGGVCLGVKYPGVRNENSSSESKGGGGIEPQGRSSVTNVTSPRP